MTLLDPTQLKAHLGSTAVRFDVDALAECDSTSSEVMRRADRGAPSGTVVVADRQSAGRGRRGRAWLSDAQGGLTFSLLWRFPSRADRLAGLSLAVGVAVARGLESLGAAGIRLKWPNDVLLERDDGFAKLAGILVELSSDRRGTAAVIGIGLNLCAPAGALPQPAAGLDAALAVLPGRPAVLAAILAALAPVLDAVAVDGFAGQKSGWMERHAWQDRPVRIVADDGGEISGVCRGVDEVGALLLERPGGIERVWAGDVSLRAA